MNIRNTTSSQDSEIKEAEASHHIQNLIAIIESLDLQITAWRSAAGEWNCDTPEELRSRINQLPETY
jgi:hypothetical protein